MTDKKRVKAEEDISYRCNCPQCGESIFSEYQDDWDIHEMVHVDQEIECEDCGCTFVVHL